MSAAPPAITILALSGIRSPRRFRASRSSSRVMLNYRVLPISRSRLRPAVLFGALGLEDAPELQARVDLAVALTRAAGRVIQAEGISQRALAERIGIDAGDLSRLMNGWVGEFSQERLERLLNHLGCDVKITLRRAGEGHPPTIQDASPRNEPAAPNRTPSFASPGNASSLESARPRSRSVPSESLRRVHGSHVQDLGALHRPQVLWFQGQDRQRCSRGCPPPSPEAQAGWATAG
jgi:predicted XRE-type DNA-binding protein